MSRVEFIYKDSITYIQAVEDEKIQDICYRFTQKAQLDIKKINFLYSGKPLELNLTLSQAMNSLDKERKTMSIMVIDIEDKKESKNLIESPFVICPTCKEPAKFEINNYRIKIYNCKNGHINDNILLSEYEKTQLIDESMIICDGCKIKNKSNTYNKEMYICNKCNMNLCPLCKSNHDKTHKIINYDDKYYICNKHNKEYNSYCEKCNKDICFLCEKEHEGHNIKSFSKMVPEGLEDEISQVVELTSMHLTFVLNAFKTKAKMVIDRLNNVMNNFEIYIRILQKLINNYNVNNINYNILQNINYFDINYSFLYNGDDNKEASEICKDFSRLLNEINNYKDFIPKIFNIYNKMNKNEIDLIYNIPNNQNEIKIFGNKFISNNKDLCKIIYENKEYNLTEYFDCKNIKNNLLKIKLQGINNIIDLTSMFEGCSELSYLSDFSNWDTTYVMIMFESFRDCKFEKLPDISKFNTNNVINMSNMFRGCSSLKSLPDISIWNTKNVVSMRSMFYGCSSLENLPDISKWDISKVLEFKDTEGEGTSDMFKRCSESLNIPEKFESIK